MKFRIMSRGSWVRKIFRKRDFTIAPLAQLAEQLTLNDSRPVQNVGVAENATDSTRGKILNIRP